MGSSITALREQFPGTKRYTYLDVAARGLIPIPTREAIDTFLDQRMYGEADKAWMFDQVEAARSRFAALIGADPVEIAVTKNVSDGINAIAAAIPWQPGDNVVICESLEHPANVFPWHHLVKRQGIQLKIIKPDAGKIKLERIIDAIDARTRAITVASVSFSPGFRFPLAELGAYCRQRQVLVIVDGAQSVGILDTDVGAAKIDALAVSTQKGLLSLYGGGFL